MLFEDDAKLPHKARRMVAIGDAVFLVAVFLVLLIGTLF